MNEWMDACTCVYLLVMLQACTYAYVFTWIVFGQYVWVCNLYTCMYDIVYLYFSRHEVGGVQVCPICRRLLAHVHTHTGACMHACMDE